MPTYASHSWTGDGVTKNYVLPFDYLNPADLSVSVNGVNVVSFTVPQYGTVRIDPAAANGTSIIISRLTDISTPAITFTDGAAFASEDFNTFISQAIFGLQEVKDLVQASLDNINADLITAGNFPAVTNADSGTFMVVNPAGVWTKYTLAATKTLLGISGTVYYLPAPGGDDYSAVLQPVGGQWARVSDNSQLRVFLNMSTLDALLDSYGSDPLADTAFTPMGVADTNVVQLDGTIGGFGALPVVSGQNLKHVYIDGGYCRVEERQASGVNGGNYPAANTWQNRSLTAFTSNEFGGVLVSGAVTVPAGTYQFFAQTYAKQIGYCAVRLIDDSSGSEYFRGVTQFSGSGTAEKVNPDCFGKIVLTVPTTLRLQIFGTVANASTDALGTAHGSTPLGQNIYTVFELYRVSQ